MARKSSIKKSEPEVGSPSISPTRAIDLLSRQIRSGEALLGEPGLSEAQFDEWRLVSEDCVIRAFGDGTDRHYEYLNAGPPVRAVYAGSYDANDHWEIKRRKETLRHKIDSLIRLSKLLELDVELTRDTDVPSTVQHDGKSVFIVHGHDHAALHSVARFIEHLGLTAIILHEQPNRGQTVIEKFLANSTVGFAVVLLTPDDVGRSAAAESSEDKPRARQNVILELGYFMGAIGRSCVCPLCVPGIEIPSDYLGTVYTPLDVGGAWKLTLARELKAAEFPVDLNKAM